jgi:SAM-dependent methyltransferase
MSIYGRDFAAAYNDRWAFWGPKMWPFLSGEVQRLVPEARSWLDLCCGTGSLLTLVCEAGFEAAGVDFSPHQLRHARENAPEAELVEADVREVDLGRTFDVVTCLFDSLNYLTTKRGLERAFRRARRHLADGGLFIFDMNTVAGIRDHWHHALVFRDPGRVLINETSFDERRHCGICRITGFVQQDRLWRRFEEEHVERGYEPEEIEALLGRVRLTFTKYDGHSLATPTAESGRLLYVCQKAKGRNRQR